VPSALLSCLLLAQKPRQKQAGILTEDVRRLRCTLSANQQQTHNERNNYEDTNEC
jgi:hypothetical protein